jgi:lactose/L-arabinose transport system substrate-binding protein
MFRNVTYAAAIVAAGMVCALSGAEAAPKGTITVWSWNVAAEALESIIPDFNKKYPDVKVSVVNMSHNDVRDRSLAGCAAGGADMPDVVTVENSGEAELYWNRFPDCFAKLAQFGVAKYKDVFPAFKWTELTIGNDVYSLPWDSGPVFAFYRRDIYEKAGVDPKSIETWDDWIAAGKKILTATGGKTKMAAMQLGSDDEWFRMLANEAGCWYFSNDGKQIIINQPGCVKALETVKKIWDAGLLGVGDWNGKLQLIKSDSVAGAIWGGWYEGGIRSATPEQAGKWGGYPIPAYEKGGVRAANTGGSSLAITEASKNKEAAWAYIEYALTTDEGQVAMFKNKGLIPSLLSAVKSDFAKSPQKYWGDQPLWADMLATADKIPISRATQFYVDGRNVMKVIVNDYLTGTKYPSAKAALDAAAKQMSTASGLPVAGG